MTHDFPTYDGPPHPPPPLVVKLNAQLLTNDPENTTEVLVFSLTPHVTGIVVLYDSEEVHEAVLDHDHVPVVLPQLI